MGDFEDWMPSPAPPRKAQHVVKRRRKRNPERVWGTIAALGIVVLTLTVLYGILYWNW